jgi:uncharacterized membrane protein YfcA
MRGLLAHLQRSRYVIMTLTDGSGIEGFYRRFGFHVCTDRAQVWEQRTETIGQDANRERSSAGSCDGGDTCPMNVDYWFLLPVGVGIAVLAMSSGISAGNFWVPVYLLGTQFDAPTAFWMTLATMLCGYGSGVARNLSQGTIHRGLIVQYLPFTVPAAVIGAYLSPVLNVSWSILLFGVFACAYGVRLLVQQWHRSAAPPRSDAGLPYGVAISGGVLVGLITVGLGELMLPRMLADRRLDRPGDAVGAAVVIIFVTSLAAALARLNAAFMAALIEQHSTLLRALAFAAPGVIVGGQLGPMLARRFKAPTLQRYVAILLMLAGILMLTRFVAMRGLLR